MQQTVSIPIRTECPPGACVCERELLDAPGADRRILMLTREEEKKLLLRIEAATSLDQLQHLSERMAALLGIGLTIAPGANEVRTVRGFQIELAPLTGLCRKTRQAIPAAVRRCLDQHPDIAYAILDANDLFRQPSQPAPAAQGASTEVAAPDDPSIDATITAPFTTGTASPSTPSPDSPA